MKLDVRLENSCEEYPHLNMDESCKPLKIKVKSVRYLSAKLCDTISSLSCMRENSKGDFQMHEIFCDISSDRLQYPSRVDITDSICINIYTDK